MTPDQIVALLRKASTAYYNGAPDQMDDETYDGLIEQLKEFDPDHPYLEEVGAPPEGAVPLPYAMPSLDKIKPGQDQLKRFLATPGGFVLSEKLDGLSALWTSTGKLLLRGDGLNGQDVSHLVPLGIQGLRKTAVAVRGELILPRSEGQPLARSWVNGQIHQKTPDAAQVAKIHFVAYELIGAKKRSEQFTTLKAAGFEIPWVSVMASVTEEQLAAALQERRDTSPYDTDGIVVGLNAAPKSESTAAKARNPKDCVAFKMPLADQSAETTVREVLWAPSAQGYLIPRIRFDPVTIGAAKIEFCTGHNARMIEQHKVGPGAKIMIRRSGDVIPKLDKVLVATAASFPPDGTWEWSGDAHIKSSGHTTALTVAKLHYFLKTLEIPGAGPATATALVDAGITGPAKLWAATADTLSKVLGPKTGASLHANLRTALAGASEATLMHASSMMPRGVGDTKLASLFAAEWDPRKWVTAAAAPTAGWTAESFQAFMKELPAYVAWRTKELSWIPYPILQGRAQPKPSTEIICMTGFRDKALEEKGAQKGYCFVPALTGKVTILLVPDGEVKESEKIKSARAKGIKILSRSSFTQQYLA